MHKYIMQVVCSSGLPMPGIIVKWIFKAKNSKKTTPTSKVTSQHVSGCAGQKLIPFKSISSNLV